MTQTLDKTAVEADDRLFVPLSTEPYRWFERGDKDVELRTTGGQFTRKHVREGRAVELRRGYSTDDSLYGEVGEVRTFETLSAVFDAIDYQRILPEADSRTDALKQAREIVGDAEEAFIAFQVQPR